MFISLLFFIGHASYAQITIDRQIIGSAGGFSTGSSVALSSTVADATSALA